MKELAMRITEQQLRKLVREEIEGKLYSASMHDLLDFANLYSSLGAPQQELLRLINDPGIDANPGAIQMLQAKLGGINAGLDAIFEKWHNSYD
jgi:hypothetical protein